MNSRRRLEVEQLGERVLPSAALALPAIQSPPALGAAQEHALTGQGHGTYAGASLIVDAGIRYSLNGVADLSALGHVTVTGSVNGVGFIAQGRATGTLTFANASGNVTVSLEGPLQAGFRPLPKQFTYAVIAATGAYGQLHDQGSLLLAFHPDMATAIPLGMFPTAHGTFTLALNQNAASGIQGVAWVGPIFPVSRPGVPNSQPLAGAVISIESASGSSEVARVTADKNGRFLISLAPGHYRIVPVPPVAGEFLPRGMPETVEVLEGEFTHVTVSYDSGIR
jgi:hypothetical protein